MGEKLLPPIAARIDGIVVLLATAARLQLLAGTAPRTRVSGKSTGGAVLRRVARDRDLHQALVQMARCSLASSSWARAFVRQYTGRRRGDKQRLNKALRALANKWVRILHHLLLTRQTYDEQRHCETLRRHHVTWAPEKPTIAA